MSTNITAIVPPCSDKATDGVFDHKGYTEKALTKLVKAKAKADRATSRREARETPTTAASTPQPTSPNGTADSTEASAAIEPASEAPSREEQVEVPQIPAKDQVLDRSELLRSKPEVVGRFMQLMVPVLIDVYAASVITSVRLKTLTGLLKAVGFLDTEDLKQVFSVRLFYYLLNRAFANFISSLFRWLASLPRFYHRRIIPPSFWGLFNSWRYCWRKSLQNMSQHSGEREYSMRWRVWQVETWLSSPRKK